MPTINQSHKTENFKDLKKEVFAFMRDQGISPKRPYAMLGKATLLWGLWFAFYGAFLLFGPQSPVAAILFTLLWTGVMLTIQLAVMHDASHGASSDSTLNNRFLASSISFLGGSAILWKHQHCIAHHNNTNVHGLDHDINTNGLLRLHPSQSLESVHRHQHIYAWVLYPLFVLSWIWWGDLRDIIHNTYSIDQSKMRAVIAETVLVKIWHTLLFLVLPIVVFQSFWIPLFCYLLSFSIMGFFMVVIFQLAHVTGVQEMPESKEKFAGDWVRQQVSTTANFATPNPLLGWCSGGLNFQIEHHLFPSVSSLNYTRIQPVVQKFCARNGITYPQYRTVMGAVRAHQDHLRQMGRP